MINSFQIPISIVFFINLVQSEYEEANSFTKSEKEIKTNKRKSLISHRTFETVFEDCFEKEVEFRENVFNNQEKVTPQGLTRGDKDEKNPPKVRNQRKILKNFETKVEINTQNTCCHGMKVCQIF